MNEYLLSHHRYQVELTGHRQDIPAGAEQAFMAGQCDCDCSSDCACSGAPNILPIKFHIEFTNRVMERERIINNKNDIIVDAPPGFGKTYLLDKVNEEMTDLGWKVVYLDLGGPNNEPVEWPTLVKQLMQKLDANQARKITDVTTQDVIRACTSYSMIVLIFDRLENADPQTIVWIKSSLIPSIRKTVRSTLRVIFSGRYIYNNAQPGEWNGYLSIKLAPLTPENILDVLKHITPQPPDDWAPWIYWLSGGHPASIEAIINELDDLHWNLRLPLPQADLQDLFQRRVCPYINKVKKSAQGALAEEMYPLWIFRVIDPEIIEYLQNAGLLPPTPDARQMQSNLSKAKLIKATKYFYSDSVFQRLISISLEVMEPAIYQEYHCRALEIFNCKLKSLYFNRTPPLPVVEAHLSEIIYHAIQASRTEAELVQHLVNSLSLLPADPLHLDSFSAALYLDENNELETRLGWSYKITRADLIEKVMARLAENAQVPKVDAVEPPKSAPITAPAAGVVTVNIPPDSVYVSYAWGGESEQTVDELEKAFDTRGIKIVRDKKDLKYKGSISEFEQRIGRGACVILVISDKYLRSAHCMYEWVEIDENKNIRERIFPIVLEDARIFNPAERIQYIKYWEKQIHDLDEALRGVQPMTDMGGSFADLDMYGRIRTKIDHLVDLLRDMNVLTPDVHAVSGYSNIINAVLKKLADDAAASGNTKKPQT